MRLMYNNHFWRVNYWNWRRGVKGTKPLPSGVWWLMKKERGGPVDDP